MAHLQQHQQRSSDEDEDSDEMSRHEIGDRIRRNYVNVRQQQQQQQQHQQTNGNFHHQTLQNQHQPIATTTTGTGTTATQETIEVRLNESYFSKERKLLVNALANCRQKFASMQMFNPAKNQSIKEQQQQSWNENEKYTLDSLNEIKGPLDEQFQWTRAEDGREVWGSKLQYFLAITSYSIGLGNVIRFPILVQKNGGLAFIIPFVIMLVLEGIPLFYLELAIGQRMRKAAISSWNLVSPFAAGIGIASAVVSFIIGLYYNTMVAWTLLYLFASATGSRDQPLPFAVCPSMDDSTVQTQQASGILSLPSSSSSSSSNRQASVVPTSSNTSAYGGNNSSESECQMTGPFEHYWYRQILDASPDVNEWIHFNWPVAMALTLAWLLSYLCLFKGLSSSKRVVYITFTFPYVILTIFFFKALQLKGMSDGIYYLFEPDWSKLVDPYVWLQAAAQVFFSLGLGFGGLIALSSYNPVNNNCYKDAIKVSLINFFTSIYAGVVIFAILGYRANLAYDKCLVEREQSIGFYLSDYNLKVLDYGAVFDQIAEQQQPQLIDQSNQTTTTIIPKPNLTLADLEGSSKDYYDTADALASIKSLDRQLDSASSDGKFDYGDSDTEFIIDASNLINKSDLDKIIDEIPGLPQCSISRELDESSQGSGLVFVVMAEAISTFNNSPGWATIFFIMLLTLGLDSQFGNLEGLLSSLADLNFATNSIKRQAVTGLICLVSLVISIMMFAHGAGSYMFAIFDEYAGSFSLVLIAFFELIAISYLYGLKRFCDDCELMTGKRPPFIILLSWRYLSPILLLVVIFATIREFAVSLSYDAWTGIHLESKQWPDWCILLGAVLILACVIWIPAVAVLKILKINLIAEESLNQCWFPAEELREFYDIQEEHKVTQLERVLFGFRSEDD